LGLSSDILVSSLCFFEFNVLCRYGWAGIHHAPIYTLEAIGGGSVRCTMAELFV
jgi:hypothetical protein